MTERTPASPLAVCVFPKPPRNVSRTVRYGSALFEILDHAGLGYDALPVGTLTALLSTYRLLLTVGECSFSDTQKEALADWVSEGRVWISIGGVCGMEAVLGVRAEPPAYTSWGGGTSNLGEGYLYPQASDHPALAHVALPLHFFNGVPARAEGATVLATAWSAHQRPTERVAFSENRFGQGKAVFLAPDLPGTVVHIQQGRAITRDGIPAPDGTAPTGDAVLKSDDGLVLDWEFDRQSVEGVPGFSAFLHPIADQWRELLLRTLLMAASEREIPLPLLWLYPRNLPALAHLSHDTDGNGPAEAQGLLDTLHSLNICSTWCVILPGYAPELMEAIRAAGHELATHYDAMSDGTEWSEAEFDRQWRELVELFGEPRPVSNKNHYLRWEDDTEFYEWCVRRGLQLDQSKGASKTGEAGFCFGSCHPYFPFGPDGKRLDVLELMTPTQDLTVFAPPALLDPLLSAVVRHHGILHLLFHPAHIFKPGVIEAMQTAASRCRAQGIEFWTAAQINTWERARRQVSWSGWSQTDSGAGVWLSTEAALPGATLLWLSPKPGDVEIDGASCRTQTVERWGFSFQAVVFDAEPGGKVELTWRTGD